MNINEIIEFTEKYGVAILAFLVYVEYLNIPGFPGGITMPAAGVISRMGYVPFVESMLIMSLAAVLSQMTVYGISYIFSNFVRNACLKYKRTSEIYEKTVDVIDKRGAFGLFTARLIPVVRTFISIPAGLMKMRLRDYIPVSVLGTVIFTAVNMILGYFFTSFFV